MISNKEARPENRPKAHTISESEKNPSASVVCFSTFQKEKKLSEAKRRVHQASANLNW